MFSASIEHLRRALLNISALDRNRFVTVNK